MKIKVCGMRDRDNIQELAELSPDYMGFIFFERSKRHVADFPEITIPTEIKKVGVVVNESIEFVTNLIHKNGLNAIQLHGNETPEYCNELKILVTEQRALSGVETSRNDNKLGANVISTPHNHDIEIIKAFSVDESFDFSKSKPYESSCDLFIFDTKGKEYGGNGVKYDWSILKNYKGETPFLLSGGIRPEDVDAVNEFSHKKCTGLDLNSGFEDAPGVKNIEKLRGFIKEIKSSY